MALSFIENLPDEILDQILQYISSDEQEGKKIIKTLRLVSKRLMAASTPLLIQEATFYLTSSSFQRLENLAHHQEFRKSITRIRLNISYYDVKLAQDLKRYAAHCCTTLFRILEMTERTFSYHYVKDRQDERAELVHKKISKCDQILKELDQLVNTQGEDFLPNTPQLALINTHAEYVKLTQDQEAIRANSGHILRLCRALEAFPALNQLLLNDRAPGQNAAYAYLRNGNTLPVDQTDFYTFGLSKSTFKGSFETAYYTEPPTEMLGEFLSQLGKHNVRPSFLSIMVDVPVDLLRFQITPEQATGISALTSRTTHMTLIFDSWARKGSLAENNNRSASEMHALGSLTKALTSTKSLQSLNLRLKTYPAFYEFPTVNLSALLPLQTMTWSNLHRLTVEHVPCDLTDLRALVDGHKNSLRYFEGEGVYLRTGSWSEVLDTLRDFENLEHVDIKYPVGERYGNGSGSWKERLDFPKEKVRDYVLRVSEQNPLSVMPHV